MHNVNTTRREIQVGSRSITLETGKLAKQADGAVLVRSGDTVVLVTACRAPSAREGIDFLPLTVDYREYTYASGRIPGGFFKREGKPTEKEVITSRLIDRPIRPLFAPGWRYETQVIALLLSADTENDSDVLAITGASAALAVSSIPFQKTIAGVRVGMVGGQFVMNPTFAQRKESTLDLVVAGTKDGIVMVEAGAKEVSEVRSRGGARGCARGDQADRRRNRRTGARAPEKEARRPEKGNRPRLLPRGRGESVRAAQRGDADSRQARELRPGRSAARRVRRVDSRRRGPAAPRSQRDLSRAQGEGAARRGARARAPARRPQVR